MAALLLNGNQAIAQAAFSAGVRYVAHYPGSPVNRVETHLKELNLKYLTGILFNDALNEHVATLAAAGASFCGARSLVVMKHVGLNIAADPLNYLGYTGVKGGMVIVVGTDPGATCSTGEEDPHWYALQAQLPLFEPTSVAMAYQHVLDAFELSERFEVPVLVFVPAGICHDTDRIEIAPPMSPPSPARDFEKDFPRYVNVGRQAVTNHRKLLERIEKIRSEGGAPQSFFLDSAELCLITRGASFGHAYESVLRLGLENHVQLLNVERTFPLARGALLDRLRCRKRILLIEDQDGFLENQIKMELFNELDCRIEGKEHFPRHGQVSFEDVYRVLKNEHQALTGSSEESVPSPVPIAAIEGVPERVGTFCEGCPHRSSFFVIDSVLREFTGRKGVIGGDIGCSSLPPQRADWLMCMNAGIGISQGMSHLDTGQIVVSTGGDGSFFHAGLISLQNAVENQIDLLHIVFDNHFVAMTGHQPSPTTRRDFNVRQLLLGVGVSTVLETDAFNPEDFKAKLRRAIETPGVRVIWVRGDCALHPSPELEQLRASRSFRIRPERCGECRTCYTELQCPAILARTPAEDEAFSLAINPERCRRCGVCREICAHEAIEVLRP